MCGGSMCEFFAKLVCLLTMLTAVNFARNFQFPGRTRISLFGPSGFHAIVRSHLRTVQSRGSNKTTISRFFSPYRALFPRRFVSREWRLVRGRGFYHAHRHYSKGTRPKGRAKEGVLCFFFRRSLWFYGVCSFLVVFISGYFKMAGSYSVWVRIFLYKRFGVGPNAGHRGLGLPLVRGRSS